MNTLSILMASLVVFSCVSGAGASDLGESQSVSPLSDTAAFSWEGGYLGAHLGYGWGKSRFTDPNFSATVSPDGFSGGFYAGYNIDIGNNVILGVEGDLAYNGLEDGEVEDLGGLLVGTDNELRWSGAVRGRAGYALDRFLPYVAAGAAFGNVKNRGFLTFLGTTIAASQSRTMTGWTAGAGVDYAATDRLVIRLEYRYTDYGREDFSAANPVFSFDTGNRLQTSDIRLGIGYKF